MSYINRHSDFGLLEVSHGIVMDGVLDYIDRNVSRNFSLAMDAQPGLVTVSNTGIPAFLANYMDPKVIEVLVTPNNAAKILGEEQKGSWVTRTITFPMVESTGLSAAYGDWNNNGSANANVQFPERQSFHYQVITQWGEKQLAEAGLAKIDWASRLNIASAMILDKFQNQTYFFGVQGLQNYGLLNDPNLLPPIQPATKVGGGRTWQVGTPNEVYADIQALYSQMVVQTGGLITQNTSMVLATTPGVSVFLSNKNSFGLSVYDMLKSTFPNITFETALQYAVTAGNMAQLIAKEVEGQDTGTCAFTEKMRAHAIVKDVSSFKQKKSQGSWGSIIYFPPAIASMVGI